MDELNNCPFCGGEAKLQSHVDDFDIWYYYIQCDNCGAKSDYYDTDEGEEAPIEAWNTRAESEPKALTLEDLTQREGTPVWIERTHEDGRTHKRWVVASNSYDCRYKPKKHYFLFRFGSSVEYLFYEYYGKTWIAYDREVKGESI